MRAARTQPKSSGLRLVSVTLLFSLAGLFAHAQLKAKDKTNDGRAQSLSEIGKITTTKGRAATPVNSPDGGPPIPTPTPMPGQTKLPKPGPTPGQPPAPAPTPASEAKEDVSNDEASWEKSLIEANVFVSEWFNSVADGLDMYLVGKRYTKRPNETSVRIENSTISQEGGALGNTSAVAVNLRLPNVEDYWQLKFTSYDDRRENRGVRRSYLRREPRQRNDGASLGLFRNFGAVRTLFQPRVELSNPLKVSHSLAFESIADYKKHRLNTKLELFASPDKGTGVFGSLNFNFYLSKFRNVTWVNEAEYQEKDHIVYTTHGLSFGQFLTSKTGMSYNLFFESNQRPNYHLESYNASVVWSQVIYRNILDYQLIPNVDFQRASEFKAVAGLTLNFNLNF